MHLFSFFFFFVRRQHVFVNNERRQFALYHRYVVWCPEILIDLTERTARPVPRDRISVRAANVERDRLQAWLAALDHCSKCITVYNSFLRCCPETVVRYNRVCARASRLRPCATAIQLYYSTRVCPFPSVLPSRVVLSSRGSPREDNQHLFSNRS